MPMPARLHLPNRLICFFIACALLSLIWFSAGSQGHLRQTYTSLYKQAKQSPAASALADDKQPDVITQPHKVTTRPSNLLEKEPHVDAQPNKATTSPTNVADEQEQLDVDVQSPKVTNPPTNEQPDADAQSHNVTTPPTNEQPDVDIQSHNVTTPPTNEQPDVDIQSHNVTTPPTNEQLDADNQSHNVTTPPTNILDEQPAVDTQSGNFTTPLTSISSQAPFPPLPPPDDEEYMAICMAVKDQSFDLPEFFIHYYFHLGIRRFYIFDDGSVPPLSTAPYPIPSSAITWIYFQPHVHSEKLGGRKGIQEKYYTGCVKMFGDRHTWMGFLDADEFLEMTGGETLSEFLHDWARNDTVGAVGVNWLVHSSAGLLTRPADGPRKAFDRCIVDDPHNDNLKVKTFVRPALFEFMWNCHCVAKFKKGAIQVGEHGDRITQNCDRKPITRERWGLHHFGTKSREEFLQKQERGKIRGGKSTAHWWKKIENAEQRDCPELTKYVP